MVEVGTIMMYKTKQEQLAAVKETGPAIEFIKDPDKDVQLAAVKQSGWAIRYIKDPDKDVQLAAVKENGYAIIGIQRMTDSQIMSVMDYICCFVMVVYIL